MINNSKLKKPSWWKNLNFYSAFFFSGGFSRCGNPLIILPDSHLFFEILESDLHMVLKYFIQVIPMAKQVLYAWALYIATRCPKKFGIYLTWNLSLHLVRLVKDRIPYVNCMFHPTLNKIKMLDDFEDIVTIKYSQLLLNF